MTTPSEVPYKAGVTADPTIHKPAPQVNGVNRLTPKQVGAIGTVIVNLILATICRAIGGIGFNFNILGTKFAFTPFAFLNGWATTLEARARDAYYNTFAAIDVRAGNPSGTTKSAPAIDVYNAQAAINSTAITGVTNAGIAGNNIQATWNSIVNGTFGEGGSGGTGTTGATAGDVQAATQYISATAAANTGNIYDTWNAVYYASGGTGGTGGTGSSGPSAEDNFIPLPVARTQLTTVTTTATSAAIQADLAGSTASTALSTAQGATAAIKDTNTAIYDGYFGSGGTGSTSETKATIEAIKTKLTSGYTLQTLTYNAGSAGVGTWTRPFTTAEAPKEFYVVAFGSGGGGGAGEAIRINANANVFGGLGGAPGGYAAVQIDATTLPSTVSYTIAAGALGRTSASRTATSGGETSFGSYLTTVSGFYNVTDVLGYYATPSSAPGVGGLGGTGCVTGGAVQGGSGATGGSSPLASGGTGGSGGGYSGGLTITAGGTGDTAPLTGTARAGGGGGGGGGGTMPLFDPTIFTLTYSFSKGYSSITPAGLGGNGGFPGGGGGGGGGCATLNASAQAPTPIPGGNGGNGAHGVIILLWK